jgi:hypothetical protein
MKQLRRKGDWNKEIPFMVLPKINSIPNDLRNCLLGPDKEKERTIVCSNGSFADVDADMN